MIQSQPIVYFPSIYFLVSKYKLKMNKKMPFKVEELILNIFLQPRTKNISIQINIVQTSMVYSNYIT